MNWFLLILAGLLEVGWAIGLKYTEGFTRPLPSVLTVAAIILSMVFLGLALKTLPVGTAYAVWVGIGIVGTFFLSAVLFNEPTSALRILSVLLIVAGIVGLKLTSGS
ncbi:MAG: quaternary ammonium compound efflux SMR transporter SugE [Endozoicomonas sp.]|uniref:quaternary ammonium compound efflux SMR transporter SugE n=1 Tax=Endozoicomonas sp. TaxID=1892382 RepID=UPI003D9BA14E